MEQDIRKKLRADWRQYGFRGFSKRLVKFFLRKAGIVVNTYYYMVNHIDADAARQRFEEARLPSVKQLRYDDFLSGDKDVFTKKKLAVIARRFADGGYRAYGILQDDHLIYSCWVSLQRMESSNSCLNGPLDEDAALFVDDYCSPPARGKGIHTAMNAYRLWQLAEMGKKQAITLVLKENKPAYKSQRKVGFQVAFTYYVANFWGHTRTNYFKRKHQYLENAGQ